MKIKNSVLLVILFFLGNQACMSQNNTYAEGFYVNHQNDTIKGFFLPNKHNILSDLKFKSDLNDSSYSSISFDTCKVLSFNKNFYKSWYGKRSMVYIDKFDFSIVNSDSFKTEMIPLKLIYRGTYLSLYYYSDVTDHFFMGLDESVQELLIFYRYSTSLEKLQNPKNPPTYFTNPVYRYQIIAAMPASLTMRQRLFIENSEYGITDLIRLFKKIDHFVKK